MAGLDTNTKLLLHCTGADESTTFDDVSDSGHTMTANGTAEVDTATTDPWGGNAGVLILDGSSAYLTAPDSLDFDVAASNTDSWTIDFWAKHDDHAGWEIYVAQDNGGSARWEISHNHGEGIRFYATQSGSSIEVPWGGEITDTNWHHISICKVADEWGVYNGTAQVGYVKSSTEVSISALLSIGRTPTFGSYFDGKLSEIRIQKSNYFNAAPNSGKTDTIAVPTEPYSKDALSRNKGIIIF